METGKIVNTRKKNVDSKFRRVLPEANRYMFVHEAIGGETSIDLTNMIVPASWSSNGFVNPNSAELTSMNLSFNYRSLHLVSLNNGLLAPFSTFICPTDLAINLLGSYLPAGLSVGEVVYGYIDVAVGLSIPGVGEINSILDGYLLGEGAVEGGWRMAKDGAQLIFQRYESGVWVTQTVMG